MAIINKGGLSVPYECSDLIAKVRNDIHRYRRSKLVYAACRTQYGVKIIFDYVFDKNNKKEMDMFPLFKEDEWFERMSLGHMLAHLMHLNSMSVEDYKTINDVFDASDMPMNKFAEYLSIPQRTMQDWIYGASSCPEYVVKLIREKLENDGVFDEN